MSYCSTCNAGCCRRYKVIVTGYDILKISQNLGITPEVFLDISELTDEDYAENISRKEALFVFTDNNCKRRYRIKMKKVPSSVFENVEKCFFLNEWESDNTNTPVISKCSIYGIRPIICQAFPAKFVNNKNTVVIPYVFERQKDKVDTPYSICKKSISEKDFGLSKDEILNILIKMDYETTFFQNFAEKWNKNPSSIEEFLEDLPKVYEDRVFFETEKDKVPFTRDLTA